MDRVLILVEVGDEIPDTSLELKDLLLVGPLIHALDSRPGVEVSQLAHSADNSLEVKVRRLENGGIRLEGNLGPRQLCLSADLERDDRDALFASHEVRLLIKVDFGLQPLTERVHHRDAHSVEPAGRLICFPAEFPPSADDGQDDLHRRLVLFLVHIDRNAAAVVLNSDRTILVERDHDQRAVPGHGLVDTVVRYFKDAVMQPSFRDIPDIHRRSGADVLDVPQYLDVFGRVIVVCQDQFLSLVETSWVRLSSR